MTAFRGNPAHEREIVDHVLEQVRSGTHSPLVISGPIGSGKTLTAEHTVDALRERAVRIGGILAPRVLVAEYTTGYTARDLLTGREQPLASSSPPGTRVGRFFLSASGLRFAEAAFAAAIESADVVVLDEVGRLEIAGGGHADSVRRVLASQRIPILLVRDDLLDEVIEAFGIKSAHVVRLVDPDRPAAGDQGEAAGRDALWGIVNSTPFPLLVTQGEDGYPHSRPMRLLERSGTTLWFATSRMSRKVRQIRMNPRVALLFVDPHRFNYVCLHGRAHIVDDVEREVSLWSEDWRDSWPDGPSDPDYVILRVDALQAQYSHGFTGDTGSFELPGSS